MEQENKKTQRNDEKTNNERPSRKSMLPVITSGIIGGITSAVIVILLFTGNIIPFNEEKDDNGTVAASESKDLTIQKMNTSDNNIPANIEELSEAVVGIINLQQKDVWKPNEQAGSGSGIIYKKENGKAFIITNNHVVQHAEEVEVALDNNERAKAKVLGTDALSDLAVLEIDGDNIDIVADLGSSKELQVGESVLAIGNPISMDFAGSVTKGIISGLDRPIEVDTNGDKQTDWITEVIQTDAAINPGNSGGALVNADGEVIGINSMKIAQQAVEGIGFAIPIDTALPIIDQLETKGEISRPFIGISTVEANQVPRQFQDKVVLPGSREGGMVIANVQTHSPAEGAGLQQFDVITKINDQEISSLLDLRKYMYSETAIGDTINIEVYRDGKQQIIKLKLKERNTLR